MSQIQVPAHWQLTKLSQVIEMVLGQAPPGISYNKKGDGIVLVKVGEFGNIYPEKKVWTTNPLKLAKEGDVLLCIVGATIGKTNLAIDCAIGRSVAALRPKPSKIIQKFLFYFLQKQMISIRNSQQGSAQGVITKDDINNIVIPLPTIETQKKIVQKLDYVLGQLEVKKKEISELQETKLKYSELLSDNFMPFLISQLIPAKNYPKNWQFSKLGEVGDIVTGSTPSTNNPENYGGNYLYFKPADLDYGPEIQVSTQFLSDIGVKKDRIIPAKSVLVVCIGASIGKVAITKKDSCTNQQINSIIPNIKKILPKFLYYWIASSYFQNEIWEKTSTSAIPIINKSKFSLLPIVIPPINEQQKIVEKLQKSEEYVNSVKKSVSTASHQQEELTKYLHHLQNSILDEAFSGKLVN